MFNRKSRSYGHVGLVHRKIRMFTMGIGSPHYLLTARVTITECKTIRILTYEPRNYGQPRPCSCNNFGTLIVERVTAMLTFHCILMCFSCQTLFSGVSLHNLPTQLFSATRNVDFLRNNMTYIKTKQQESRVYRAGVTAQSTSLWQPQLGATWANIEINGRNWTASCPATALRHTLIYA